MLHPHIPHDDGGRGGAEGSLGGGARNVASLQQLWGMQRNENGGGGGGGGGGVDGEHDDYDSEDDDDEDDVQGAARFHRERLQAMNARSGLQFAANPRYCDNPVQTSPDNAFVFSLSTCRLTTQFTAFVFSRSNYLSSMSSHSFSIS